MTIGTIHGGTVDNVIPETVELRGTIRYKDPAVQEQIHTEIERALGIARTLGGDYRLRIEKGYPPMVNDAGVVNLLRAVATDLLGPEHIRPPEAGMGAEDFGYFSALAPGAMLDLGCRPEDGERPAHSPRFDIDERCLPVGAAILAEAALRLLRGARLKIGLPGRRLLVDVGLLMLKCIKNRPALRTPARRRPADAQMH
ncbi:MAG: M20/M25/M40 family metallo-hydrolase [Anaerolineae bacterium]|nr:M20/M25/M40 family metallo-hydrolase [Anaerolineae bacterium]